MLFLGFLGEAVPYNSGLLSAIKAHGYFRVHKHFYFSKPEDLLNEITLTNRKAVLLIRNPYRVIYSFRNHVITGDHQFHANISDYLGPGIL